MVGKIEQCIHLDVSIKCKVENFFAIVVYRLNGYLERRKLWKEMERFSVGVNDKPQILLGDFNAIKDNNEKMGGNFNWENYKKDMNECYKRIEVENFR